MCIFTSAFPAKSVRLAGFSKERRVKILNRKIVHLYNFFIYLKAPVNLFTLCYSLIGKKSCLLF